MSIARISLISLVAMSVGGAALASNCDAILRLGYDNVRARVSVEQMRTAAFNDFCSSESDSAQSAQSRRIQGAYLTYSGQASTNDEEIKQKRKEICDKSSFDSSKYSYLNDTSKSIHQGTIDAWTRCIGLENDGLQVEINPDLQISSVTVAMHWTKGGTIKLNGIETIGKEEINCSVASVQDNGPVEVGKHFDISGDTTSFTCRRALKINADGATSADYARIVFNTSTAPVIVDLPPIRLVEVEQSELAALTTRLSAVEDDEKQQKLQISRLAAALGAFKQPRRLAAACQPGAAGQAGCVARCDPDEIAIGGECFVDGHGGNPQLQNAGMGDDNSYGCTFNGSPGPAHATAWCVKRPQ